MHKLHALEYETNQWVKDTPNDDHGAGKSDDKEDNFSSNFTWNSFLKVQEQFVSENKQGSF